MFSSLFKSLKGDTPRLAVSPSDRRTSERFQWKGTASIAVLPSGPEYVCVLVDLSEGGCGIELGAVIPAQAGDTVRVVMYIRGATLERMGIIRHLQIRRSEGNTRMGIEFVEENHRRTQQYSLIIRDLLAEAKAKG